MTTTTDKTCPCADPDCRLPAGRCCLCDQPCHADDRTSEHELCAGCAERATVFRERLWRAMPDEWIGWHVDTTGTPRLVASDDEAVFSSDDDAVAHARRLMRLQPILAGDTVSSFVEHQQRFSSIAFGPERRTLGITAHIRKELTEIEANPDDVEEWIDVVILGLDGAWRHGHSPADIERALWAKLDKNKRRSWPDWRTVSNDKPIEHRRAPDDSFTVDNTCDVCGQRCPGCVATEDLEASVALAARLRMNADDVEVTGPPHRVDGGAWVPARLWLPLDDDEAP